MSAVPALELHEPLNYRQAQPSCGAGLVEQMKGLKQGGDLLWWHFTLSAQQPEAISAIELVPAELDPGCAINRPRLLQGPLPHTPEPPCPAIARDAAQDSTAPIDRMLAGIQARWPGQVAFFRPVNYFCETECPIVKDGIWLYQNRIHLTLAGSRYMVTRSGEVFRQFLRG